MRFTLTATVAALVAVASVAQAQDANCSAVLNDYTTPQGQYTKCFTNNVYNTALVAAGGSPNYKDLIDQVCSKSACSHSELATATTKYLNACNASVDLEASQGNILQLGKNALTVFFAEPIREIYCAEDPNAPTPTPTVPPTIPPPVYCLATEVANPALRFVSNLAVYLTSGTVRSSQDPFFIANNLDVKDVCSPCSQVSLNATVDYLSKNLMPKIAPFYTPEFVQYWSKLIVAYNGRCNTTITQTWPAGTLNTTAPGVPTGAPTHPPTVIATATATATATSSPTPTGNSAAALKPVAGLAAMIMAVAALL